MLDETYVSRGPALYNRCQVRIEKSNLKKGPLFHPKGTFRFEELPLPKS